MSKVSAEHINNRLRSLVIDGKVLSDSESLQTYGIDWTRKYSPKPVAVVLPRSTKEVQAIVLAANEDNFALVPSGGRTGLSGGAVAAKGEVVISFELMNNIIEFNRSNRTVLCQAGVITQQLQEFAVQKNLYYPVDFAAAGSSQLGGNVATNAGGIKVIRWGMTRDWVTGMKVVTGKGDVLELNKDLVKNNTGYDLRHLFIGSEGTLGLITEVTMKLARPPGNLQVLVLGLSDFHQVMSVLTGFSDVTDLTAFEFFSHQAMAYVLQHTGTPPPFKAEAPFYVLIEFDCIDDTVMDRVMSVFEGCVENGWVIDGVVSQSQQQASTLWKLRESISESIASKLPYKNDISVVPAKVPEFLNKIDELVRAEYPDFEIIWFGHIGDGNLHLNILKPDRLPKEAFFDHCERVNALVFATVKSFAGSVSAEHGVGLLKKDYLTYTRSPEEIVYLRGLKQVFDPNNVINPGKLVDPG